MYISRIVLTILFVLFLFFPSLIALIIRKVRYQYIFLISNLFLPVLIIFSTFLFIIGWLILFWAAIIVKKRIGKNP